MVGTGSPKPVSELSFQEVTLGAHRGNALMLGYAKCDVVDSLCRALDGPPQLRRTADAALPELDIVKAAEGFAGTVSYGKAVGLLTNAKTQQSFERHQACVDKSERARFCITESRRGR